MRLYELNHITPLHVPGVPKKNATDLKNSDTSCFKLIIESLFFSKSAIVGLKFDIFCRIFGDLVAELKINKL